ncbi:unnamed protein product [Urochloa humidicola]
MEMEDSEEEMEEEQGEEEELVGLPEEWTYQLQKSAQARGGDNNKKEDSNTKQHEVEEAELTETKAIKQSKAKAANKWGPLKVERRSRRNLGDTRTMLERAKDNKRKKAGEDFNEFNLEKPGKSVNQNSGDGTKLDNFVPPGAEERDGANHLEAAEICRKARADILGASRLNQRLMEFLIKHGADWELKDVPEDVLLIMKATDAGGHQHGWLMRNSTQEQEMEDVQVQNAGCNTLEACFQFN